MLYRVLDDISDGKRTFSRGTISPLKGVTPAGIVTLLERGIIASVRSPPLRVIPGWEQRAELLKTQGITTVEDLVEADLGEVSEALDVPEGELHGAAQEVLRFIEPTEGGE